MLTESEIRLAAYAYALRHDEREGHELWFAVEDDVLRAADSLMRKRWFDRSWRRREDGTEDMMFRLSDQAMTAYEMATLVTMPVGPGLN
jgi:hypothetical protein